MFDEERFEALASVFRGDLIRSDSNRYETARRVWNAMIDKQPAVIARCTGVADVTAAIDFARDSDLPVAVRGGGHSVAGHAVCDGGIVIDLSPLKGTHVDADGQTARAQPGVTWGEFDRDTQVFGLATTGGTVSTTGIAGLTLGGGHGWLGRKHGMTCDNLRSAEVVTASGDLVRASAAENGDLFWGLRGGGGNFGVVTSFEYRLHPVGPTVLAGVIFHDAESAPEVLRFYRDYVAASPNELTVVVVMLTAPAAPFLPQVAHGRLVLGLAVGYAGDPEEGEKVLAPLRAFGRPLADTVSPIPYPALQSMLDETYAPGRNNYWKSSYLRELPDAALDTIVEHAARMPSPLSTPFLAPVGGAISSAPADETAVGHRDAAFDLVIESIWTDPQETEAHVSWANDLWTAMQPFSTGSVYVNNLGDEGEDRVRTAYTRETYTRLVALKDKYDPTNLFRLNQNIRPSVEPASLPL